jgi:16S rRNA (cytosine1407-C5)-methyltransferase
MNSSLPPLFLERLREIIPDQHWDRVVNSFSAPNPISIRINTLKTDKKQVLDILRDKGIICREIAWANEALILENVDPDKLEKTGLEAEGFVYRQGLSSMLPVVVLDPAPQECILDMCAAPGSKATQMAARMGNKGCIVGIEAVHGRYYKFRSVAQLLGAGNISVHLMDARRFRPKNGLFGKILLDVPCSSEGRFQAGRPKTLAYWSPRKIKEMVRKQKGLALSASRLLRPGGALVYSTCTFAPEENEGVVDWLLKKTGSALEVESVDIPGIISYPALTEWDAKVFNAQVKKCLRVLPGEGMEGFFLARFKKNN